MQLHSVENQEDVTDDTHVRSHEGPSVTRDPPYNVCRWQWAPLSPLLLSLHLF